MIWRMSHRADPAALPLADRHYNRQKIGSPQFVPPGRCIVLLSENRDALWVSSWPFAEYVKHRWPGAWVNSLFRYERTNGAKASELIGEALAITRYFWGDPPALGMVTFVDADKVIRKRDAGRCYRKAGFVRDGETQGGLLAWRLTPEGFPPAMRPYSQQMQLEMTA
jgi:hypothetical protein